MVLHLTLTPRSTRQNLILAPASFSVRLMNGRTARKENAYSGYGRCWHWKVYDSRTVARELTNTNRLGASFFFKRGKGDRSNAARFFTTIASQLVQQLPSMSEHVRNAIEVDPSVIGNKKKEQCGKLILEPLMKVYDGPKTVSTLVVVINALDECDKEEDVKDIIGLLPKAKQLPSI
ncbi:hypothetical protein K432DRAFT_178843 [Lepidopterella palustris CBS 459.81]|uniref:Nephrocystin 3-like N-terminal domain-containing protein n=1 Tax=Lepidopterella palustris CBS 459.81 TaxID=1314670 RepID=A0A8E2JA91_9PEZI|nr:hypothetical protein K432DRAFT_178843 [Lepidopterella palustris CBS 459.81]